MSQIDYRVPVRQYRWVPWALILLALVTASAAGWWGLRTLQAGRGTSADNQTFYTVVPQTLEIFIRKDGELQAVNNTDIVCQVEGQSTVRTIVPEGSYVRKGDLLFELDSSELRRKIQQAQLEVHKAQSDLTAATEQLSIQESKNTADLEAANVELKLAQLDLQEYTEGKHPQQLSEALRGVQMAEFSLRSKEQALGQTKALHTKGFVTQSEVEQAQLEFVTAQNEYEKKTTELRVLRDFTHAKELADKQNKVAQAEKKVARVKSENASTLAQKLAEVQTRQRALVIHTATLEHFEKQLEYCTVHAPTDGIVVYGSTVQSYYFRETPIQPGARVVEQQLVVRVPETTSMKAVARIGEHQAVRLRIDKTNPMRATVRIVGFPDAIGASVTAMSVLSDNQQRWLNPDLKEFPVDLTLDHTPPGLKPGASCAVEIVVERIAAALAVPVSAVYTHGTDSYVFVRKGGRVVERRVSIGECNDTHVQVVEGLSGGEQVLLLQAGQGRDLLKLPDPMPAPASQPSAPAEPTGIAQAISAE